MPTNTTFNDGPVETMPVSLPSLDLSCKHRNSTYSDLNQHELMHKLVNARLKGNFIILNIVVEK